MIEIDPVDTLAKALVLKENESPFPWQKALLEISIHGQLPTALDIPTGLGKTAVMAIWLVARAAEAKVPRRLVYIVDRRAVVDQATDVALGLRAFVEQELNIKASLGLDGALPISTLRGQHVDNREWLENPTSPAIVIGTVDMIGSRLLFEGYGISRRMRPYHAGLLGADTLVVLDEAHLVPPFEKLLASVSQLETLRPNSSDRGQIIPQFKLLTLSATGKNDQAAFGLGKEDFQPGTVTHRRLNAVKRLRFQQPQEGEDVPEAFARAAWCLIENENGKQNSKILVYCDKRKNAVATKKAVEALAKGDKKKGIPEVKVDCQLFVGERRVRERQEVALWLKEHCFLAGSKLQPTKPTFVFATSAGEVGVDLDADHMVCDLVAWERMVQRFGRVNRRGDGNARIVVIREPEPKPPIAVEKALAKAPQDRDKKEQKAVADFQAKIEEARALAKPFELLPREGNGIDVSPAALRQFKISAKESKATGETIARATSPVPLRPALMRAVVDAWAMTSLKEHTGRPRVQPWLRGWVEDEEPQTVIVWRAYLPLIKNGASTTREIEAFFEAAPPHTSEMLEARTRNVLDWLKERADQIEALDLNTPCGVVLDQDGELRGAPLTPADFRFYGPDKKENEQRERNLQGQLGNATLVISSFFGGLSHEGLLDGGVDTPPRALDDGEEWLAAIEGEPVIRFRVCTTDANSEIRQVADANWRQRFRMAIERSAEGEPLKWLIVEKWRYDIATPDDGAASAWQSLDEHQRLVAQKVDEISDRLHLPEEFRKMLRVAARLHDEGKKYDKWQNAFSARPDGRPYAKTPGPINRTRLDGYRHEFGSLAGAAKDQEFQLLPDELKDLALHIIAAHHGFARPTIGTRGCPDAPPSLLEERARAVALRFARMQRQWGPWGLAWWESLLRAADQQASRELELKHQQGESHG